MQVWTVTKPKVSEVKHWFYDKELSNQIVEVYYADIDNAFIKTQPLLKVYKTKYFYGETAWMDSRRYANDIYTKWEHANG
jgi:hypothetical protein